MSPVFKVYAYLDVDAGDEQCWVQRKSAAAVHREELLHLLQTVSEDTLDTDRDTHGIRLCCPLLDYLHST